MQSDDSTRKVVTRPELFSIRSDSVSATLDGWPAFVNLTKPRVAHPLGSARGKLFAGFAKDGSGAVSGACSPTDSFRHCRETRGQTKRSLGLHYGPGSKEGVSALRHVVRDINRNYMSQTAKAAKTIRKRSVCSRGLKNQKSERVFGNFRGMQTPPPTRPHPEPLRSASEQGEGPAPPLRRGSPENMRITLAVPCVSV